MLLSFAFKFNLGHYGKGSMDGNGNRKGSMDGGTSRKSMAGARHSSASHLNLSSLCH